MKKTPSKDPLHILNLDKESEAIQFLKDNEPEEGYYLCFSGGKDSIVIKQLAILSGVKWAGGYSFPGIDPPEIVQYIRKYHSDIEIISSGSFFKNVQKKGPPTIFRRWCCDTQKKNPQNVSPLVHQIQGIRAEESVKRAKRERIGKFKKKIHYYPIFYWKEWEVWEFIEKHNLPYCELYDISEIHRIGCCICPFQSERERLWSMERWPGYWKAYKNSCLYFYYLEIRRRKKQIDILSFYAHYPTFEDLWEWIGIKGEWKPKTKKLMNKLHLDL